MVPERVEHRGNILNNRSDTDDIEVAELGVFPRSEVLVGDVPPADDRDLVVDREGLVVHAPVDAADVADRAQRAAGGAAFEGVEDPDLEVRVRVQCRQPDVETGREHVVDQ